MIRKSSLYFVMAAVAALSISATACSGGGDDDDDGTSPTPPINNFDFCQANFDDYNNLDFETVTGRFSRYGILANTPSWTSGTHNLGSGEADYFAFAILNVYYDNGTNTGIDAIVVSTQGSVTVTAPLNSIGQPVDITAHSAPFFFEGGDPDVNYPAATGTDGSATLSDGAFSTYEDCFLSTGNGEDCIQGGGGAAVTVLGSDMSLGTGAGGSIYLFCDDVGGFADMSMEQKVRRTATKLPVRN